MRAAIFDFFMLLFPRSSFLRLPLYLLFCYFDIEIYIFILLLKEQKAN